MDAWRELGEVTVNVNVIETAKEGVTSTLANVLIVLQGFSNPNATRNVCSMVVLNVIEHTVSVHGVTPGFGEMIAKEPVLGTARAVML